MPSILETKIHCADLAAVRHRLLGIGAARKSVVRQRDTYFDVRTGWLKLRTTNGESQLVAYHRQMEPPRSCTYFYLVVNEPDELRDLYAVMLGNFADVYKTREKWQIASTTIHLDKVDGLGEFVELETSGERGKGANKEAHQRILDDLNLNRLPDIEMSYANLQRAQRRASASR